MVEQWLDVRAFVVCRHQQRDVSVRAQRIGGMPGDRDHPSSLLAEIAADLAERGLLAVLGKRQQHVAWAGRRHAGGHVRGVEVVHGEDSQQRQLQRKCACMDVVLAQPDDEHAASRSYGRGRRLDGFGWIDQPGRFLGFRLASPETRRQGRLAVLRRGLGCNRAIAIVGADQGFADRELEVWIAFEPQLLAELDHAGLADPQRIGQLLRGVVAQKLRVFQHEVGDPAFDRRHLVTLRADLDQR